MSTMLQRLAILLTAGVLAMAGTTVAILGPSLIDPSSAQAQKKDDVCKGECEMEPGPEGTFP